MAEMVLIGCRLANGITLRHPNPDSKVPPVKLNGFRQSPIINAHYGTTPVDAEFWSVWRKAYASYKPLTSGAIFQAANANDLEAKGKELADEKTGFEPMKKDAMGVKPALEKE